MDDIEMADDTQDNEERRIKQEIAEDDRLTFQLMQQDKKDLQHALRPTKRGRPVGSGAGQKRKQIESYSTNKNTMKARKRMQMMTDYEKQLERAKNADAAFISRKLKAFRQSQEYVQMSQTEQIAALHRERSKLETQRKRMHYSANSVIQGFENKVAEYELFLSRQDQEFVSKLRAWDIKDDHHLYWQDTDDILDTEQVSAGANDIEQLTGQLQKVTLGQQRATQHTEKEVKEAFRKSKAGRNFDPISGTAWRSYKASINTRIALYKLKLKDLRGIDPDLLAKAGTYGPGLVFNNSDKALMRFAYANAEDTWIDLPGPSAWWPTVKGDGSAADTAAMKWYPINGFEPRSDLLSDYRHAAQVLQQEEGPTGWMNNLLRAKPDLEIVWNSFFSGY